MPSIYDQSLFTDTTPPDDAYNVTNPTLNGIKKDYSPSVRADAFRRKRLDMQGNVIDLNNMPADATVIKNDRGPAPQFDINTPQVDRAYASQNMQRLAKDNGTLDENTGYAKRAPLKGYNDTTGEYFTMAAGGERVSDARAREWANRIRANDTTAAGIARDNRKSLSDEADAESKRREVVAASQRETDKLAEIARHNKAVEDEAIRNGDVNRGGVTATEKRAQATFDQAAVTADLARADQMEPQARAAIYAKHGISLDQNEQKSAQNRVRSQRVIDDINSGMINVAPYKNTLSAIITKTQRRMGGFGAEANAIDLNGESAVATNTDIANLSKALDMEADRVAANYGVDRTDARQRLLASIATTMDEKTPHRLAILRALAGAVEPVAKKAFIPSETL